MYNLVILEDDPRDAAATKHAVGLSDHTALFDVTAVSSIEELAALVGRGVRVDILLADIQLGVEDHGGIDAVRDLFPRGTKTQVIYTTGREEARDEVYETEHVYFLLKPYTVQRVNAALSVAVENLARLASENENAMVVLDLGRGRVARVNWHDIVFAESKLRRVYVHTARDEYSIVGRLDAFAETLPQPPFLCCHKSYLVNMEHIERETAQGFELRSKVCIPISKSHMPDARIAFCRFAGHEAVGL